MELFLLCLKVFVGRIIDVSLSTMNTMYLVKGKKLKAVVVGTIDVLIWFLVVKEAINTNSNSIYIALAYAGGYAAGTYIGYMVSQKVINSYITVQIITEDIEGIVTNAIKKKGYAATIMEAKGLVSGEKKYMIYAQMRSSEYKEFRSLITRKDKLAFITVVENKESINGYFGK